MKPEGSSRARASLSRSMFGAGHMRVLGQRVVNSSSPEEEESSLSDCPSDISQWSIEDCETTLQQYQARTRIGTQAKTTAESTASKPNCRGVPLVWANELKALYHCLLYFASYHPENNGRDVPVRGFFFDPNCQDRDFIDDNVIISRASGGLHPYNAMHRFVLAEDQQENAQIRGMKANIQNKTAVAIVLYKHTRKAPVKLPYPFNVLGWFQVTHVWCERTNHLKLKIWKFRFERIHREKTAWWLAKGARPGILGHSGVLHVQVCSVCRVEYPQIYTAGWICLSNNCNNFWKLPSGIEPNEDILAYDQRFLKQRNHWPLAATPDDLVPTPTTEEDEDEEMGYDGDDDDDDYDDNQSDDSDASGYLCPNCGYCIPEGGSLACSC